MHVCIYMYVIMIDYYGVVHNIAVRSIICGRGLFQSTVWK